MNDSIDILGVQITIIDVTNLHMSLNQSIRENEKRLYLHANAMGLNIAYEYPWFRDFLNTAKVVFCDGVGIMLAARILGYPIPPRITYADWIWQLAEFAESNDFSLFFLGSQPGIAEMAASRLKEYFPGINIVGVHHGFFDKQRESITNKRVIRMINSVKPAILVVGFGMPLQEKWLMENWSRIDVNVALTGGAVFDYASGNLRRAPRLLTDHGFEWLGRLIIEPHRLWKRYVFGNPLFIWRVLKQRFGLIHFDKIKN
jgi:N-acetylglucosaminyldiphosphoundecaprenol N-acetyl-beta-D-mannosaminyltransferase